MPFSLTTKANVPFKIGLNYSHTTNNREFYNEPYGSSFIIASQNIWAQSIDSDPATAQSQGIVSQTLTLDMEPVPGISTAYYCKLPASELSKLSGFTNPLTGLAYATNDRVGHIIPIFFGSGYRISLKDGSNVEISEGDVSNWFLDPFAGVVSQENSSVTPATIECRIYTGKFLNTRIDDLETELGNAIISGGGVPYSEIERLDLQDVYLQTQITDLSAQIGVPVDITRSEVAEISGYLDNKIDSVESRVVVNESDITDLRNDVDSLSVSGGAVLPSQIDNLQTQITTISGDLDAHKIDNDNSFSITNGLINDLSDDLDGQKSRIDLNELGVNNLETKTDNISGQVQQNTIDITALQLELDDVIISGGSVSQSQFQELTYRVDIHDTQISSLSASSLTQDSRLDSAESNIVTNINAILSNSSAIVSLASQTTQLESDIQTLSGALDSNVNDIESQITVLSGAIDNNSSDIQTNQDEIVNLQTQIDNLVISSGGVPQSEIDRLDGRIDDVENDLNTKTVALSASIEENFSITETAITALSADVEINKTNIISLQEQDVVHSNAISLNTSTIIDLQTQIDLISGGDISRAEVAAISGDLQNQIDEKLDTSTFAALSGQGGDVTQSDLVEVSGNLQAQIDLKLDTSTYAAASGNFANTNLNNLSSTSINKDLVPDSNETHSLGTSANRWNDLFLSNQSIHMGSDVLSTSGSSLYVNSRKLPFTEDTVEILTVTDSFVGLVSAYPPMSYPDKWAVIDEADPTDDEGLYYSNGVLWDKKLNNSDFAVGIRTDLWDLSYVKTEFLSENAIYETPGTIDAKKIATPYWSGDDVAMWGGSDKNNFMDNNITTSADFYTASPIGHTFRAYKIFDGGVKLNITKFEFYNGGFFSWGSFYLEGMNEDGSTDILEVIEVQGDGSFNPTTNLISVNTDATLTIFVNNPNSYIGYGAYKVSANGDSRYPYAKELKGFVPIDGTQLINCVNSINKIRTYSQDFCEWVGDVEDKSLYSFNTAAVVKYNDKLYAATTDISASSNAPDINSSWDEVLDFNDTIYKSEVASLSGDLAKLNEENTFTSNNTFNNDVTILGTLTVAGSALQVNQEHVLTKDNIITVNAGEVGSGVTSITAGIEIDRGDLEKYGFLFDENQDIFKVGELSNMQAVGTREENPINGAFAFWNATTNRFETSTLYTSSGFGLSGGPSSTEYTTFAVSVGTGGDYTTLDQAMTDYLANDKPYAIFRIISAQTISQAQNITKPFEIVGGRNTSSITVNSTYTLTQSSISIKLFNVQFTQNTNLFSSSTITGLRILSDNCTFDANTDESYLLENGSNAELNCFNCLFSQQFEKEGGLYRNSVDLAYVIINLYNTRLNGAQQRYYIRTTNNATTIVNSFDKTEIPDDSILHGGLGNFQIHYDSSTTLGDDILYSGSSSVFEYKLDDSKLIEFDNSGTNLSATNVQNAITEVYANTSGAGGGGANTSLSNLTSTSINTSLIPDVTGRDLGSSSLPWKELYLSSDSLNLGNDKISVEENNLRLNNGLVNAPGGTWVLRSAIEENSWRDVAYGNGIFVAVSNDAVGDRIMTSYDGITWTARTPSTTSTWYSVVFGNGVFVVVANSGNSAMTSIDGINWTTRTVSETASWQIITYGNGLFVAAAGAGATNRFMTSPDGITWTSRVSTATNIRGLTYAEGIFVAVGSSDEVYTSPDGITWTSRTAAENNNWFGVTYGNGLFVAVADGATNQVMTSPDGITWTARSAPTRGYSVTYGRGLFVATAGSNGIIVSKDGINWTGISVPGNLWYRARYVGGLFIVTAVGGSFDKLLVSGVKEDTNPLENHFHDYTVLPTSSTGLETGRLWIDTSSGNVLKVVL